MASIFAIDKLQSHMHIRKTPKGSVMVLLQREFWQLAIQMPRRVGPILYLQVAHQVFPVLRATVPWLLQLLHAPLQMGPLPHHQCQCSGHHLLHKEQLSHLCKSLGQRGLVSLHSLVRQCPKLECHHHLCSSSGHLLACPHHLLRPLKFSRDHLHHQLGW